MDTVGAPQRGTPQRGAPQRGAPQALGDLRILLVEDDAGDALLVEELLADSDLAARLTWATSLAEALVALPAAAPQCVLLDLHLPDALGLQALAALLRAAPTAAVVVLTGLAEEGAGLSAVTAGAQDYLVKGRVEPELFGRAIRYAVHRKQAEHAAAALQAERMRAQENARLERGLLPSPLLNGADVDVVARYQPGRSQALLGGDFYDVVQADDGMVHAVIGDVSGHGPDEAALGVCLRIAWRTLVLSGVTGTRLLRQLERIMTAERSSPELFATVCGIALHPDSRKVRVLRAGHPGLLLRRPPAADGTEPEVELLEPAFGPALGLLPGLAAWPEDEIRIPDGGSLVMFTDGLFEGRTSASGPERLGEDGLIALARRHARLPGPRFVDALIHGAEEAAAVGGGLADDVAVVHMEWKVTP
ncbi:PP2C family protein-serine/threonine phosphatase [Wenjunlia tyrosinilytica]|uniref:Fused response regulator/phosphatase n=1 Tax=Wenjunlia tyrosinilytica TaxID=1544741 RepID=A0A917ZP94_9ACTN|nr:SpoIIE family protein phosphatase [Wenjunlia tyrosinilytica]GGO87454.1 fused response regulator/phosphatase [Wenjunlia tyrosinilytica]